MLLRKALFIYYLHMKSQNEYVLSRQVLKSGTSIGANIEEAQGAQSKRDFIAKMQIALKEAKETKYWLRLFRDTGILDTAKVEKLIDDCGEMIVILTAILKKAKL